ncbi:phytochrome-like protein cph1 [mine drainage metagenome]|uniref:histidine kinase n=1 Tax=mine drainage metagenome TaxID=410659 RepID=A0A1J5SAU3_9ZZZZ
MPLRNVPIRRKVIVIVLLTSGIVMLLMRGSFLVLEYLTFRRDTVQELSTLGRVVADNSTAALAFRNRNDARQLLASLATEQHLVDAALYDDSGRLFAAYTPAGRGNPPTQVPSGHGYFFDDSGLAGLQPVVQAGRRLGTLYLRLDTRPVTRDWLRNSVWIAAAVMAFVMTIAYLLSRLLQTQITRPILQLTSAARAISERRDYSVRTRRIGRDEIGELTDAFNTMLDELQDLHAAMEARVAERTAQLQAANRELEAFSYSVSHDLRAPLRHIDGFAHLLDKRIGAALDPTDRRYLDTIMGSTRNLGVLIDELLAFSRMGRAEMQRVEVPSRTLVDEVVRSLQPDLHDRAVEWRIGNLPTVHADPAMLRQVWANLLGNAVKYTRGRAPAVIEVFHHTGPGGEHVFAVRDNGAGFDMQYVDKLFGVFQRLHGTSEFEGTGIGLAHVKRIIHRHGGRVWAEGRVNEGATFFFTLPV